MTSSSVPPPPWCVWANSAQEMLATDVGRRNAQVRRQHLTALVATLREITRALAKMAVVNPGTAAQKHVAATQKAAQRFADSVTDYLEVVPVATLSMDKRTVAAFGALVDARDAFTEKCGTIWDGY